MAAAVVVANPVAPPVRDLQISTTQLSTNPEAVIPFDKDLLKSISQPSEASTFNAALAQILGALAAEADRIGTEVNSDLSAPLAASATQTPSVDTPSADVPPGATPDATPSASTTVLPPAVAASTPTVQQVVSDLTADTAYLGNKVVEAAYAAVDALVNTPDLIFKAVRAVLVGDLAKAFATIVQAVRAFFDPGVILVGGIDDVVGQYVLRSTNSTPSASAVATDNSRVVAPRATAAGEGTSTTQPETTTAAPGSAKPRQTKSTASARHATTDATSSIDRPQLPPGSSASAPGTGNPLRSAGPAGGESAEQPKSKASGPDKPGSASAGRSQNAGGRGASARD